MSQIPDHSPTEQSSWQTQAPLEYAALKREYEALQAKHDYVIGLLAKLLAAIFTHDMVRLHELFKWLMWDDGVIVRKELDAKIRGLTKPPCFADQSGAQ